MVEEWVSSSFTKLRNISAKVPPEVGESVLWRRVKTGRAGFPSTTCEYFNGKVHRVEVEDNEIYLHVDCFAEREFCKIHISYIEHATEEWLVALGGRCYKESELRKNFIQWVKCPTCIPKEKWFPSEYAYCQHWDTVHKSG